MTGIIEFIGVLLSNYNGIAVAKAVFNIKTLLTSKFMEILHLENSFVWC
jgi:hypothetical protein